MCTGSLRTMNFIDDETAVSQDSDILVPSSQQDIRSSEQPRPHKRRRINPFSDSEAESDLDAGNYDLPSNEIEDDDDDDSPDQSKSKYEEYMHVPTHVENQTNEFVTQVEQPWSSPSAIRGPRWRKRSPTPTRSPQPTARNVRTVPRATMTKPSTVPTEALVDEFDDDDAEMLEALVADEDFETVEALRSSPRDQPVSTQHRQLPQSFRQTTLFGLSTTQRAAPSIQNRSHNRPLAKRNETPTHHKVDRDAMKTWTYPMNVGTIRDYQYNIVYKALFHNLLVALPTGLGKTFIAATVMLNYFSWTKDAQIVFVAPTKPLVAQQVDACFHIAGIPRSSTTLLTGEIQPAIRAEEWNEKRVFFMTPQTLINDLKTGMADPKKIVLLVVDEAHKATGNYAYVEVVRFLRRFNQSFRVLALTATPGSTVEAVQRVIDGLGIARTEIRTEESLDIRSFVHSRNIEVQLFDNSEEVEMCLDLFASAVRPVLQKVNGLNAYFSNDPRTMTLYGLLKGREQWTKSPAGRSANFGLKGMVNSCFKPLMSLAHNLELLKFHGIGPFYHKMRGFEDEASGSGKYAKQIVESESFRTLMNRTKAWINDDDFVGHPKLSYLKEVVLNHFMDAGDGRGTAGGRPPSDTRIMIFAHYRDSAEEIVRVLNKHAPMIRPHVFVGQSGTKDSEGMDQKKQIDIIKKFKAGTYNTLVATSIGEEGLDIGEVDLIVCYDCSKSPVRMLQRMGRTGRKRAGNIVLLLMRGKEERDYASATDNYRKMQELIESGKSFQYHEDESPRIIPREIQPVVDKRHVEIPVENTQGDIPEPRKRKTTAKRPPKKFHMPDGVETGFAFLGNGKSKKARQKTPEPVIDTETAVLPPLADVLLSTQDEKELEHRYAQVTGEDPEYVQPIRLDVHSTAIHKLTKTKLIKHSSVTKRLVKASKAMRKESDWTRPAASQIIRRFPRESEVLDEPESTGVRGKKKKTPKKTALPALVLSDTTVGPEDEDEYDVNDSFVDDNPQDPASVSSDEENIPPPDINMPDTDKTKKPFYVFSEPPDQPEGEDEEDLIEMDKIFNKPSKKVGKAKSTNSSKSQQNPQRKRGRRVLSDDSDE